MTPVFNDRKELVHYIGVGSDITARKRAEADLGGGVQCCGDHGDGYGAKMPEQRYDEQHATQQAQGEQPEHESMVAGVPVDPRR